MKYWKRGAAVVALLAVAVLSLRGCGTLPAAPGKLYDVGGLKLHLLCSGPADTGLPTVLIESGGGVPSVGNHWLQRGLETSVRVCTYDRAGMGWSEASDAPHDAATIVTQLHRLLAAAQVRPPYVFAGHSIGGLFETVYTGTYPDEVVGLVYLDPSHPQQFSRMPGVDDSMRRKGVWLTKAIGVYTALGLMHVYNFAESPAAKALLTAPVAAQLAALAGQSKQSFATAAELAAFDVSGREAEAVKSLGDRPVTVLSAVEPSDAPKVLGVDASTAEARQRAIYQMHDEIAALSTRGRHVSIEGATHMSLVLDRKFADQAVAQILAVVHEAAGRP